MSSVSDRPQSGLPRALLAYGLIGGIAAALVLLAGVWIAVDLRTETDALVTAADTGTASLAAAADTLDATGGSTAELGSSMRQTTAALGSATSTLEATAQALRSSATAADGVSVLGTQPLSAFAGSLQTTASQVQAIGADLVGIDSSLAAAQPGVDGLPARLSDLSARLRDIGARMDAGAAGLRDGLTALMVWLVLGLTLAVALPAAGASAVGLWLRSQP